MKDLRYLKAQTFYDHSHNTSGRREVIVPRTNSSKLGSSRFGELSKSLLGTKGAQLDPPKKTPAPDESPWTYQNITSEINKHIRNLPQEQQSTASSLAHTAAADAQENLQKLPDLSAKDQNKAIATAIRNAIDMAKRNASQRRRSKEKIDLELLPEEASMEAQKIHRANMNSIAMPGIRTGDVMENDKRLLDGDYQAISYEDIKKEEEAKEEAKKAPITRLPFSQKATEVIAALGESVFGALDEFFLYRDRETMEREKAKYVAWETRFNNYLKQASGDLTTQQASFKQMNRALADGNWSEVLEGYGILKETGEETEEEKKAKQSAIDITKCDFYERKGDNEYVKTSALTADDVKNANIEKFDYQGGRFKITLKNGATYYTIPSSDLKLSNGKLLQRIWHQVDQGAYDAVSDTWTFPKRSGSTIFHSKNANFKKKGANPMVDRPIRRHELLYIPEEGKHYLRTMDGPEDPRIELPDHIIETDDDVPPDKMDLRQFDLGVTRKPGKAFMMFQVDTEDIKIEHADKLTVDLYDKKGNKFEGKLSEVIFYRWKDDKDEIGRNVGVFNFFTKRTTEEGEQLYLTAKDGIISYKDENGATKTLNAYDLHLPYNEYNIDTQTQILRKIKYTKDPLYSPELDERQRAWLSENETRLRVTVTEHINHTKRQLRLILENENGEIKKIHEFSDEDKEHLTRTMTQIVQGDSAALQAIAVIVKDDKRDWSYDTVPPSALYSPKQLFQEGGFMHDEVMAIAPLWEAYENLVEQEKLQTINLLKNSDAKNPDMSSTGELAAMEQTILGKYIDINEYRNLRKKHGGPKVAEIEKKLPIHILKTRIDHLFTKRKIATRQDEILALDKQIHALKEIYDRHKVGKEQSINEVRKDLESLINDYNAVDENAGLAAKEELSRKIAKKSEQLIRMLTPSTEFQTRLIIEQMIGTELATRIAREQLKSKDINITDIKVAIDGLKGKKLSAHDLFLKIEQRLDEGAKARKKLDKAMRRKDAAPSAESLGMLRKLHGKLKNARGNLTLSDNPGEVFPPGKRHNFTMRRPTWLHNLTWDMRDIKKIAHDTLLSRQKGFKEQIEENIAEADIHERHINKAIELYKAIEALEEIPSWSTLARTKRKQYIRNITITYMNDHDRLMMIKSINDAIDNRIEYAKEAGARTIPASATSTLFGNATTINDIETWLSNNGDNQQDIVHNAALFYKRNKENLYATALIKHHEDLNNGVTADIAGLRQKIARYRQVTTNEHIQRALDAYDNRVQDFERSPQQKKSQLVRLVRQLEHWKRALQPLELPDPIRHKAIHDRIVAIYKGKDNTISNLSQKLDELSSDKMDPPPTDIQKDMLTAIKIDVDEVKEQEYRLLKLEHERRRIIAPLRMDISKIDNAEITEAYTNIINGNAHDLRALELKVDKLLDGKAFTKITRKRKQLTELKDKLSRMQKEEQKKSGQQESGQQEVLSKQEVLKRIQTEIEDILVDLPTTASALKNLTDAQKQALDPLLKDVHRKRFNGFLTLQDTLQDALNIEDGKPGGPKNGNERRHLQEWMSRVDEINSDITRQSQNIWKQEKLESLLYSLPMGNIHPYVMDTIQAIGKGKTPQDASDVIGTRLNLAISPQEKAELLIWQRRIDQSRMGVGPESFERTLRQIDLPLRTSPLHTRIAASSDPNAAAIQKELVAFENNTLEDIEGLKASVKKHLKRFYNVGDEITRLMMERLSDAGIPIRASELTQHVVTSGNRSALPMYRDIAEEAAIAAIDAGKRETDIIRKHAFLAMEQLEMNKYQKEHIAKEIEWRIIHDQPIESVIRDNIDYFHNLSEDKIKNIEKTFNRKKISKAILTGIAKSPQEIHIRNSMVASLQHELKINELEGEELSYINVAIRAAADKAQQLADTKEESPDFSQILGAIRSALTPSKSSSDEVSSTIKKIISATKLDRSEKLARLKYDIDKAARIELEKIPEVQELKNWERYLELHTAYEKIDHDRIIAQKTRLLYHFTDIRQGQIDQTIWQTIEQDLRRVTHYPFQHSNLSATIQNITTRLNATPPPAEAEQAELRALQERLEYVHKSTKEMDESFKSFSQQIEPFTRETDHITQKKEGELTEVQKHLNDLLHGKTVNLRLFLTAVEKRKETIDATAQREEHEQLTSLATKIKTLQEREEIYKDATTQIREALLPLKLPVNDQPIIGGQLNKRLGVLQNGQTHNLGRLLDLITQRQESIDKDLATGELKNKERANLERERDQLLDYRDRIEIFQSKGHTQKLADLRAQERSTLLFHTKYLTQFTMKINHRLTGGDIQPLKLEEIEKWKQDIEAFTLPDGHDSLENQEVLAIEREELLSRLSDFHAQYTRWNNALDQYYRRRDEIVPFRIDEIARPRGENNVRMEIPRTFAEIRSLLLPRPARSGINANTIFAGTAIAAIQEDFDEFEADNYSHRSENEEAIAAYLNRLHQIGENLATNLVNALTTTQPKNQQFRNQLLHIINTSLGFQAEFDQTRIVAMNATLNSQSALLKQHIADGLNEIQMNKYQKEILIDSIQAGQPDLDGLIAGHINKLQQLPPEVNKEIIIKFDSELKWVCQEEYDRRYSTPFNKRAFRAKIAELISPASTHQSELTSSSSTYQSELTLLPSAYPTELIPLSSAHQTGLTSLPSTYQSELTSSATTHQIDSYYAHLAAEAIAEEIGKARLVGIYPSETQMYTAIMTALQRLPPLKEDTVKSFMKKTILQENDRVQNIEKNIKNAIFLEIENIPVVRELREWQRHLQFLTSEKQSVIGNNPENKKGLLTYFTGIKQGHINQNAWNIIERKLTTIVDNPLEYPDLGNLIETIKAAGEKSIASAKADSIASSDADSIASSKAEVIASAKADSIASSDADSIASSDADSIASSDADSSIALPTTEGEELHLLQNYIENIQDAHEENGTQELFKTLRKQLAPFMEEIDHITANIDTGASEPERVEVQEHLNKLLQGRMVDLDKFLLAVQKRKAKIDESSHQKDKAKFDGSSPSEDKAKLDGSSPSEDKAKLDDSSPSEDKAKFDGSSPSEDKAKFDGSSPSEDKAKFDDSSSLEDKAKIDESSHLEEHKQLTLLEAKIRTLLEQKDEYESASGDVEDMMLSLKLAVNKPPIIGSELNAWLNALQNGRVINIERLETLISERLETIDTNLSSEVEEDTRKELKEEKEALIIYKKRLNLFENYGYNEYKDVIKQEMYTVPMHTNFFENYLDMIYTRLTRFNIRPLQIEEIEQWEETLQGFSLIPEANTPKNRGILEVEREELLLRLETFKDHCPEWNRELDRYYGDRSNLSPFETEARIAEVAGKREPERVTELRRLLLTQPKRKVIDNYVANIDRSMDLDDLWDGIDVDNSECIRDMPTTKKGIDDLLKNFHFIGNSISETLMHSISTLSASDSSLLHALNSIHPERTEFREVKKQAIITALTVKNTNHQRIEQNRRFEEEDLRQITNNPDLTAFISYNLYRDVFIYGHDIPSFSKSLSSAFEKLTPATTDAIIAATEGFVINRDSTPLEISESLFQTLFGKLQSGEIPRGDIFHITITSEVVKKELDRNESIKDIQDVHAAIRRALIPLESKDRIALERKMDDLASWLKGERRNVLEYIRRETNRTINGELQKIPAFQELNNWQRYLTPYTEDYNSNDPTNRKKELLYHFTDIEKGAINRATWARIKSDLTGVIHYPFKYENIPSIMDIIDDRCQLSDSKDEKDALLVLLHRLDYVNQRLNYIQPSIDYLKAKIKPFTEISLQHIRSQAGAGGEERVRVQQYLNDFFHGKPIDLDAFIEVIETRCEKLDKTTEKGEFDQLIALKNRLSDLQTDTGYKDHATKVYETLLTLKFPVNNRQIQSEQLNVRLRALKDGQTHNLDRLQELIAQRIEAINTDLTESPTDDSNSAALKEERLKLLDYQNRIKIFQNQDHEQTLAMLRFQERTLYPPQTQYFNGLVREMALRLTSMPRVNAGELERWKQMIREFKLPDGQNTPQNRERLAIEREELLQRLEDFHTQYVHWATAKPITDLLASIQAGTSHDYDRLLKIIEIRLSTDERAIGRPSDQERNQLNNLKRHLETLIKNESEEPYLANSRSTYPLLVKPLEIKHITTVAKEWPQNIPYDPGRIRAVNNLHKFVTMDIHANRITTIRILSDRIQARITDHPGPGITETHELKKTQNALDDLVIHEQELNLTIYRLQELLKPLTILNRSHIRDQTIRESLHLLMSGGRSDIIKLIRTIDQYLVRGHAKAATEHEQLTAIGNELRNLRPFKDEITHLVETRLRLIKPLGNINLNQLTPEIQMHIIDIQAGRLNIADLIKHYADERLRFLESLQQDANTNLREDPEQPKTAPLAPVAEQISELHELKQRATYLSNVIESHPDQPERGLSAIKNLVKDLEAVEIIDDLQPGDNEQYIKEHINPLIEDLKKNRPPTTIYHFRERIAARMQAIRPAPGEPFSTEYIKLQRWQTALESAKDGKELFNNMEAIHRIVAPFKQPDVKVDLITSTDIATLFHAIKNGKSADYPRLLREVENRLQGEGGPLKRGEKEQLSALLSVIEQTEKNDGYGWSRTTSLSTRVENINHKLAFFDNEDDSDIDATEGLPTYLREIKARRFLIIDSLIEQLSYVLQEGDEDLDLINKIPEYERKVLSAEEEGTLNTIKTALVGGENLQALKLDLNTIEDPEIRDSVAATLDNSNMTLQEVYDGVVAENKKNPSSDLQVIIQNLQIIIDMEEESKRITGKISQELDEKMLSHLQEAFQLQPSDQLARTKEHTIRAMRDLKRANDYIDEPSAVVRALMLERRMPQNLRDAEKEAASNTDKLTDAEVTRLAELQKWIDSSHITKNYAEKYDRLKTSEEKSGEKSPKLEYYEQFFAGFDRNGGAQIRSNRKIFAEIKAAIDKESFEAAIQKIETLHDFKDILKRMSPDDPNYRVIAYENEWIEQLRTAGATHQAILAQNSGKLGAISTLKLSVNTIYETHHNLANAERSLMRVDPNLDMKEQLRLLVQDNRPGFTYEHEPVEALFNGSWDDLPGKTLEEKRANIMWYSDKCAEEYILKVMMDKNIPRYVKSELSASIHKSLAEYKAVVQKMLSDRAIRQEGYNNQEFLNSEALRKMTLEQRFGIARMKEMKAMIRKLLAMQLMIQSVEQVGMGAGGVAGGFDDALARLSAWFGGWVKA